MARIAGVNIPTNKRVIIALTYIHGIGPAKALEIADKLGIDHTRRIQDLFFGLFDGRTPDKHGWLELV